MRAQVWRGFVTRKGWQQQQLWEVTVAVLLQGPIPSVGTGREDVPG